MSVEVEFMDYMFKSYLPANHVSLVDDLEDIFSPASPRPPQPPPEPRCSFSHNPLHDTESLWWVAISSLYLNGTGAETSVEEVDHRIRRANEIFPRVLGSRSRYQFFLAGLESDITTTLPPVFQAPAKALDRMGLRLKHLDSKAELPLPGGPIDNTVFPEGVVGLQKCFVKIKDHSVGIPLVWLGDVLRQLSPGRSGQERGNTGLRSVDEKESES
ncbi:hypothetical protein JAAARDRAFT_509538 [Jaapia argillacea MUCL 33604]|uniref:Uncharacterized protein n=1 Tax=Jaapia argillacea MUCL 33604 TaxID=933084 RepID=A0A067QFS1_9AGAM|nr:hypothetical protein JAAARDRAFT_509538 [Jaapia argillacea MUCL 33604]